MALEKHCMSKSNHTTQHQGPINTTSSYTNVLAIISNNNKLYFSSLFVRTNYNHLLHKIKTQQGYKFPTLQLVYAAQMSCAPANQ